MDKKNIPKKSGEISRREFLKDAGLVVGGAAIPSTVLLAACGPGEETTATVTTTVPGPTSTVTTTAPGATTTVTTTAPGETSTQTVTTTAGEVTKTVTETVSTFVCPICSQEFDTLAALKDHFAAAHPGEAPAALNVINFTVNGWKYELQVEPNWTLRELLHDRMGWTGIKDMCTGYGACGSCTVIMDGRPVLSCMMLSADADGKNIETAEGIFVAGHPLIEAYNLNQCSQCGYCTPGFVVTAKALLDRNPNPVEEDIRDALGGNLCRCGTYPAHIKAVLAAAKEL